MIEKLEQWWQTTGLNLSHKEACTEAFKLGMSVVDEDHRLARAIERRREVDPGAQPSLEELKAIDRILVREAGQQTAAQKKAPR